MKYVSAIQGLPEAPDASQAELEDFSSHLEAADARRSDRLSKALARDAGMDRDIVSWTLVASDEGDADEALWRGFLGAHFGEPIGEPEAAKSAARILCAYGDEPTWLWPLVFRNPVALLEWLQKHRPELTDLQFGNHRKYEAKKPDLLYEVLSSFVAWIHMTGGSPSAAFATSDGTEEQRFDTLFKRMNSLKRFGRLGRFDLLCLYGDLGVLPIRPGSCYLVGSTGPLAAARRLWRGRSPLELSQLADAAAGQLGVTYPVFEDALCNWQK